MRVLIVAPNISTRMGGEAVLPYHYIREMRRLGADVDALTHARVRDELEKSAILDADRLHFVEDAGLEKAIHRLGRLAPSALRTTVFNSAVAMVTLYRLAGRARTLGREIGAEIIHQPTPVSPQIPSFLHDMPAPVVIGPLNGGMDYPPAFERDYAQGSNAAVKLARNAGGALNAVFPGKRRAAKLLVANERTRAALPKGVDRSHTELLVENGVDLSIWPNAPAHAADRPTFVFVGRLVWWKAVELLIEAFGALETPARLLIIGDGDERAQLEKRAAAARSDAREIEFLGFRPQKEIGELLASSTALVLPSLRECGGAVVLEAAASGAPSIATNWGGPTDYITPETGILVDPTGRAEFIAGLAAAMTRLAGDKALAERMGAAARARIEAEFSWRAKARRMLEIYEETIAAASVQS